jgi:hypothetical protein
VRSTSTVDHRQRRVNALFVTPCYTHRLAYMEHVNSGPSTLRNSLYGNMRQHALTYSPVMFHMKHETGAFCMSLWRRVKCSDAHDTYTITIPSLLAFHTMFKFGHLTSLNKVFSRSKLHCWAGMLRTGEMLEAQLVPTTSPKNRHEKKMLLSFFKTSAFLRCQFCAVYVYFP